MWFFAWLGLCAALPVLLLAYLPAPLAAPLMVGSSLLGLLLRAKNRGRLRLCWMLWMLALFPCFVKATLPSRVGGLVLMSLGALPVIWLGLRWLYLRRPWDRQALAAPPGSTRRDDLVEIYRLVLAHAGASTSKIIGRDTLGAYFAERLPEAVEDFLNSRLEPREFEIALGSLHDEQSQYSLSVVGFSGDRCRAILSLDWHGGLLIGCGATYELSRRESGRWAIQDHQRTWIS